MRVETMLVGVNFRPRSAKLAVEYLKSEALLRLERDAENPYDINAIKVIEPESGEFIGFIKRTDNTDMALVMDGGTVPVCTVMHNGGIKECYLAVEWPDDAVKVQKDFPARSPADDTTASLPIEDEIPF